MWVRNANYARRSGVHCIPGSGAPPWIRRNTRKEAMPHEQNTIVHCQASAAGSVVINVRLVKRTMIWVANDQALGRLWSLPQPGSDRPILPQR